MEISFEGIYFAFMKRKIKKDIGNKDEFDADISWGNFNYATIDEVIEILTAAKTEGATHIDFSGSTYGDSEVSEVYIQPILIREETDEEYELRLKRESDERERQIAAIAAKEMSEYERLRNIYGDKEKDTK